MSLPGLLWPALWGGDQQGQQRALQCRGGLLGPSIVVVVLGVCSSHERGEAESRSPRGALDALETPPHSSLTLPIPLPLAPGTQGGNPEEPIG